MLDGNLTNVAETAFMRYRHFAETKHLSWTIRSYLRAYGGCDVSLIVGQHTRALCIVVVVLFSALLSVLVLGLVLGNSAIFGNVAIFGSATVVCCPITLAITSPCSTRTTPRAVHCVYNTPTIPMRP